MGVKIVRCWPSGTIEIQEDSVKEGNAKVINILEPDANAVVFVGDTASLNLALFALLGGRTGGQKLYGGTQAGMLDWLELESTTNALKGGVRIPNDWVQLKDIVTPWLSPGGGQIQLYSKSGLAHQRISVIGYSVELVLGSVIGAALAKGQLGGIAPSSTTWSNSGIGIMADLSILGTVPVPGLDSNGRRLRSTTNAALGAQSGIYTTGTILERDALPWGSYKLKLSQTTNSRYFCGWTDQTLSTMVGSDNPPGEYIGLQYSTDRGDTEWKFVAKVGGSQTVYATGDSITTNPRYLRVLNPLNTSWLIQLLDPNLSPLASRFITSGLAPGATTALRWGAGIESRAAATAVSCDLLHGWTILDR